MAKTNDESDNNEQLDLSDLTSISHPQFSEPITPYKSRLTASGGWRSFRTGVESPNERIMELQLTGSSKVYMR